MIYTDETILRYLTAASRHATLMKTNTRRIYNTREHLFNLIKSNPVKSREAIALRDDTLYNLCVSGWSHDDAVQLCKKWMGF